MPTANVLRLIETRGVWSVVEIEDAWPEPAVGESTYYRWYFTNYVRESQVGDDQYHPVQPVRSDPVPFWTNVFLSHAACSSDEAHWTFAIGKTNTPSPRDLYCSPPLSNDSTYRIEVRFRRESAATMSLDGRIYIVRNGGLAKGGTEVLLYDGDDLRDRAGGPITGFNALNYINIPAINSWYVGINGVASTDPWPILYWDYAGVAVCANNWCGPYPIAGVEN
jgi:hypothetical protein